MTGKTVIVTGGSRGIGAATARLAAQRGYAVCVNYAGNRAAAEAVVGEIEGAGGRAIAVQGDVADETQVETLFEASERALGPVTLGIGIGRYVEGIVVDGTRDVRSDVLRKLRIDLVQHVLAVEQRPHLADGLVADPGDDTFDIVEHRLGAAVLGVLVLKEPLTGSKVAGLALAAIGVLLVTK